MNHIWKVGRGFGKKKLEEAINVCNIGDTILVDPGEYIVPEGVLLSGRQIEIKGVGEKAADVVMDARFYLHNQSNVTISNLTLKISQSNNVISLKTGSRLILENTCLYGDGSGTYPAVYVEEASAQINASEIYLDGISLSAVYATTNSRLEINSSIVESLHLNSNSQGYVNNTQIVNILYLDDESMVMSETLIDFKNDPVSKYALAIYGESQVKLETASGDFNNIDVNIENGLLDINQLDLSNSVMMNIKHNDQSTVQIEQGEGYIISNVDEEERKNVTNQQAILKQTEEKEQEEQAVEKIEKQEEPKEIIASKEKKVVNEKPALEQLGELYGLTEVKKQINSFINTVKFNKAREDKGLKATPLTLHSLFLGNPGTGKTTVARLLGQVLYEEGVIQTETFVEATRKDLVGMYIGHTAEQTQKVLESAHGGILFIDEAYTLYSETQNDFGGEAVDTILKYMEDYRDDIMIIFAGYTNEMQNFLSMNPGLKSRVPNQFDFEDYSPEEIAKIGYLELMDQQYFINEQRYKEVVMSQYMKSVDHSNARWVRNFNQKLTMIMAERVINTGTDDSQTIEEEDFDALIGGNKESKSAKLEESLVELEGLIGLQSVKDYVNRLVKQVKVDRLLAERGEMPVKQTYHMTFEGNPGTGKTTVANILAELFYNLDILPSSNVVVVDRSDLVGQYIGHTENQTKQILNQAMGGVLFIDEAYQLSSGGGNDFGKQAIETLITYLENYRDKFIVILAGYTNEMEHFLDVNPGLRSRIPEKIIFPDYEAEEVAEIVCLTVKKNWQVDEDYLKSVVSTVYQQVPFEDRANGRWARNFSEKLIQSHKVWLVDRIETINDIKKIPNEVIQKTSEMF